MASGPTVVSVDGEVEAGPAEGSVPPPHAARSIARATSAGAVFPIRMEIKVGGFRRIGEVGARTAGKIDHLIQQEVRTFGPAGAEHRVDGLEPFPGFRRIDIVKSAEIAHTTSTKMPSPPPRGLTA